MPAQLIGKISRYYSNLGVAGLDLIETLRKGDRVHIQGHTTDVEQTVDSMEIEHEQVSDAGPGSAAAIKVSDKVREGDEVYRET